MNATTGNVTPLQVGSGFGSGAITDPPTVDSSNQRVIVSAGANAASTAAVAVQADTTTPLGNPVTANIGSIQGSSLAAEQGAFDTNYYNWSGTGGNPGHFFVIGSTATTTAPTLYEIPFGGVNSVNISGTTTAGYTNPTVTFSCVTARGEVHGDGEWKRRDFRDHRWCGRHGFYFVSGSDYRGDGHGRYGSGDGCEGSDGNSCVWWIELWSGSDGVDQWNGQWRDGNCSAGNRRGDGFRSERRSLHDQHADGGVRRRRHGRVRPLRLSR